VIIVNTKSKLPAARLRHLSRDQVLFTCLRANPPSVTAADRVSCPLPLTTSQ